jgi:PAS domain S-box-containing protein
MTMNPRTADHLIETATDAIRERSDRFHEVLDRMPAPIYVTDQDGTITYFNQACVEFAGRTPKVGSDKWCVTWKLFTLDGDPLPHDKCPMAVALRDGKAIREVEAIAERPDGRKVHFVPFPTPLFDCDGNLAGAVNLLMDVTAQRSPSYLRAQAARCRRLAAAIGDLATMETLQLMAAKYDEQALRLGRGAHADND